MAENEAAMITHVVMRPPPGTRFSIWGSDLRLDFQKGREREIIAWLRNWIDTYVEPMALRQVAIREGLIPVNAPFDTFKKQTVTIPIEAATPIVTVERIIEEIESSDITDITEGENHGKSEE